MRVRLILWSGLFFTLTGMGLLTLNAVGLLMPPRVPEPGLAAPDFAASGYVVPGYTVALQSTDTLEAELARPSEDLSVEEATDLVFASMRHEGERRINAQENWLLWAMGRFYEPLGRTQEARRLVAGGAGICSEVAQVLKTLLEKAGYRTRFVGLGGHVVLKVETPKGWQVADPDYGVVYPVRLSVLERPEGAALMESALRDRGFPERVIRNYVGFFQSTETNTVLPVGSPLSPRLYKAERAADWLQWILPLLFCILGLWLAHRPGEESGIDATGQARQIHSG